MPKIEGKLEKISGVVWDVRPFERGKPARIERYQIRVRVGKNDMHYAWFKDEEFNIEDMMKLVGKKVYWEVEGD